MRVPLLGNCGRKSRIKPRDVILDRVPRADLAGPDKGGPLFKAVRRERSGQQIVLYAKSEERHC